MLIFNLPYKMKYYIKLFFFCYCSLTMAQIIPINDNVSTSFKPVSGQKYVLQAWVKEDVNEQKSTYDYSRIRLVFFQGIGEETTMDFSPQGAIIDGWQLISRTFTIPEEAISFNIKLQALPGGTNVYFDDVRIFPFNGNMKSFVYDPVNQRLMAELDENNYATFYEYDLEGGLVRIKKETERGVKTIQETRSGTVKNF